MLRDLLQEQEKIEQEVRAQKLKQYEDQLRKLDNIIADGLSHLPDDLLTGDLVVTGKPKIEMVYREITHPELTPFYIFVYSGNLMPTLGLAANWNSEKIVRFGNSQVPATDSESTRLFLYQRHVEWLEKEQKIKGAKIQFCLAQLGAVKKHFSKLLDRWANPVSEPERAQAAFDKLVTLDPEHKPEWEGAFAHWQEGYQRQQAELEKQEKEEQKQNKAIQDYTAKFKDWLKAAYAITNNNLEIVQHLQETLDIPYQVVDIERGILMTDDDGYREVNIDTVTVLVLPDGGLKDDESYFYRLKSMGYTNCRTERYLIPCIIGISEPRTLKPTDGKAKRLPAPREYFLPEAVPDGVVYIYAGPNVEVSPDFEDLFQKLPPEPEETVMPYLAQNARREAMQDNDWQQS